MRAHVWQWSRPPLAATSDERDGRWTYDVVTGPVHNYTYHNSSDDFSYWDTWREAFDAACGDLQKRDQS